MAQRILVADGSAKDRSTVASVLRQAEHDVIEASDAVEAWNIIQREQINFVIADCGLSVSSGPDLCRKIRAAEPDRYIYVVLCTSRRHRSDLICGMDAGADDFLIKPVSEEELRARVRAGERLLQLEHRLAEKNKELERSNAQLQGAYERIQSDVRAAAWIQENLLPAPSLSTLGVACNWRYRPSNYMAGDIFNFFAVDDRHVGFYLLDVSGHGVPAAMFSVALSMMLSPDGTHGNPLKRYNAVFDTYEVLQPGEVMAELNRRFQSKDDRYFTMSYGLLDSQSSLLRLAQAGNPNPVLIGSGGRVHKLTNGGMPVGLWPELDCDYIEVPFAPGDRLVLYSDGLTECTNTRDEEFGDERLMEYFARAAGQPLETMLNGLERHLEDWRGSAEFTDDISLLAVELTGQETQLA